MGKAGWFAGTKTTNGKPIPVNLTDEGKLVPRDTDAHINRHGNRKEDKK